MPVAAVLGTTQDVVNPRVCPAVNDCLSHRAWYTLPPEGLKTSRSTRAVEAVADRTDAVIDTLEPRATEVAEDVALVEKLGLAGVGVGTTAAAKAPVPLGEPLPVGPS